jgi:transposase
LDTGCQPIPQPRTKRRYRSAEERRRVVEETLVPGTSVAIVARAHGVNANQVFAWRKLYHAGRLGSANATSITEASTSCVRLLPVTVSAEVEPGQQQTAVTVSQRRDGDREPAAGVIELTLAKAQLRITGKVEASVLRLLLECLRG